MIWIVSWGDSSEIRAQLYCWEGNLDLSFCCDDVKDGLDKLRDDQRLDVYLRLKSVAFCRAALPLLLIGL